MPIGFNPTGTQNEGSGNRQSPKKEPHNTKTDKSVTKKEEAVNNPAMDDDSDFDIQPKKTDKKLIYIGVAIIAILAIALIYYFTTNGKKADNAEGPLEVEDTERKFSHTVNLDGEEVTVYDEDPYVYDEDGNPVYTKEDNTVVKENAIDPGVADYSTSTQNTTTSRITDPDETLKDINGVDIKATYNVLSRDYVYDYVSYTAKRGVIDDGMEIYWLEADYHGKKYRLQVPFYYFKDFDEKGVCKVQVEVLNIEGGGKVISYMQVVSDDAGSEGSDQ